LEYTLSSRGARATPGHLKSILRFGPRKHATHQPLDFHDRTSSRSPSRAGHAVTTVNDTLSRVETVPDTQSRPPGWKHAPVRGRAARCPRSLGSQTIHKLTCCVSGTDPSTLERERACPPPIGEPKKTEARPGRGHTIRAATITRVHRLFIS
jgi:hypothetical protein